MAITVPLPSTPEAAVHKLLIKAAYGLRQMVRKQKLAMTQWQQQQQPALEEQQKRKEEEDTTDEYLKLLSRVQQEVQQEARAQAYEERLAIVESSQQQYAERMEETHAQANEERLAAVESSQLHSSSRMAGIEKAMGEVMTNVLEMMEELRQMEDHMDTNFISITEEMDDLKKFTTFQLKKHIKSVHETLMGMTDPYEAWAHKISKSKGDGGPCVPVHEHRPVKRTGVRLAYKSSLG